MSITRTLLALCVILPILSISGLSAVPCDPLSPADMFAAKMDIREDGSPVVVTNPLSWTRTDVAKVDSPFNGETVSAVTVVDGEVTYPAQVIGDKILFIARRVPGLGHKVFFLKKSDTPAKSSIKAGRDYMENEFFRIQIDLSKGAIKSIYDKINKREITPKYKEAGVLKVVSGKQIKRLDVADESEILEAGPVRTMARLEHSCGKATFVQDILLYEGLPRIDISMTADWSEAPMDSNTSLSMSFQTALVRPKVSLNAPGESALQKWIDLSDNTYGISILNYYNYACSVKDNMISVILPAGSTGQQFYETVISIYPHSGDLYKAETPHRAYELSNPLNSSLLPLPKLNNAEVPSKSIGAG